MNGLRGQRRTGEPIPIEEIFPLTDQFYGTLSAQVERIGGNGGRQSREVLEEVRARLEVDAEKRSWHDAYRIEQLLVDLYDDDTVRLELERRLQETHEVLSPDLARWYEEAARECEDEERRPRRKLLARLVNDLQWRYLVSEVKRGYSKAITRSSGTIFIVTQTIFLVVVLVPFFLWLVGGGDGSLLEVQASSWYHLLLAGTAGAWGAAFSMLSGLKNRLEAGDIAELKVLRSKSILFSRPLVGVGGALILYFFVVSGLLEGNLFPDFTGEADDDGGGVAGSLALLVVWSFLAGFSEKLVTGILSRTEARFSRSQTGPDRVPPRPAPPSPPPVTPHSPPGNDGGATEAGESGSRGGMTDGGGEDVQEGGRTNNADQASHGGGAPSSKDTGSKGG